ncbi:tetratricopeptide repeat protein [bacterium]|nr:tetratricopeptide repeat protein [bacterium]
MTDRSRIMIASISIVLVTFLLFFPATGNDFISDFDDGLYITKNLHVRDGLNQDSLTWAFTSVGYSGNWHPLTWLSHLADIEMFGFDPWGHHLVSVLLHTANALFVFLVLVVMTGEFWPSLLASALFAVHPLRVESVAFTAQRKDVLSALLLLICLWSYHRYTRRPGLRRYLMLLFFFIMGLMAKPMLVTLPFILLLLDFWPLSRFSADSSQRSSTRESPLRRLAVLSLEKTPLFLLSVGSSMVTFIAQKEADAVQSLDVYPFFMRIGNAVLSYGKYLVKTFYPSKLAFYYPFPQASPPALQVLAVLAALMMLTIVALLLYKKHPYFTVGWLWYVVTLLPVIGIVQVGAQAMADRYTYVPHIGLSILLAWGLTRFAVLSGKKLAYAAGSVVAAILLSLAVATRIQIAYWQDGFTLFSRAVEVTSGNALAHNNLGNVLSQRGQLAEAISHYKESIGIQPRYAPAYYNLGNRYQEMGQYQAAIASYLKAISHRPDYTGAIVNLGNTYFSIGDFKRSAQLYRQASRLDPDNPRYHFNLGLVSLKMNDRRMAVAEYETLQLLEPRLAEKLLREMKSGGN